MRPSQGHLYRSHDAGTLGRHLVGDEVRISGWVHRRRDLGGLVFLDLRDATGLVQVRVDAHSPLVELASGLRPETVVCVAGPLVEREAENPDLPTGSVEVVAHTLELLSSPSEVLPLQVAGEDSATEVQRLTYRFLDLRKERLQRNIQLRNDVVRSLRQRMWGHGFQEFQTPILTASSPEGARDYLVPSRVHPGKFYALPQAPQQFKQLLMASGFPRYFQIAPCFRDEDARADRSPGEFYQLDIEMAFVTQDDVFAVAEDVLYSVFREFSRDQVTPPPFPRIPYGEALRRFGSDKPDLRIPFEIHDATEALSETEHPGFASVVEAGGVILALPVPALGLRSRRFFEDLESWVREAGGPGLAWLGFDGEKVKGNVAKRLSDGERTRLAQLLEEEPSKGGSGAVLMVAGPIAETTALAGRLRVEVARRAELIPKGKFHFCWVVDFPMYERDEEGALTFSHNPFS
ncbi:MAG: aspartate--tRNA ligase, partial [Myxococcota bacterium]